LGEFSPVGQFVYFWNFYDRKNFYDGRPELYLHTYAPFLAKQCNLIRVRFWAFLCTLAFIRAGQEACTVLFSMAKHFAGLEHAPQA
jgi:hypothetical protein